MAQLYSQIYLLKLVIFHCYVTRGYLLAPCAALFNICATSSAVGVTTTPSKRTASSAQSSARSTMPSWRSHKSWACGKSPKVYNYIYKKNNVCAGVHVYYTCKYIYIGRARTVSEHYHRYFHCHYDYQYCGVYVYVCVNSIYKNMICNLLLMMGYVVVE